MCALFKVPRALLPERRAPAMRISATPTRRTSAAPFPSTACAGDQQAALVGHGCFKPGMAKCDVRHRRVPGHEHGRDAAALGQPSARHRRLRNQAGLRLRARRLDLLRRRHDAMAARRPEADQELRGLRSHRVSVAGQWRRLSRARVRGPRRAAMECRSARHDRRPHARLAPRSHRPRRSRSGRLSDRRSARRAARRRRAKITSLLVDGGLTANAWAMQFLADICDVEVARPAFQEVTALGAAKLAAFGAGAASNLDGAGSGAERTLAPAHDAPTNAHRLSQAGKKRSPQRWLRRPSPSFCRPRGCAGEGHRLKCRPRVRARSSVGRASDF